MFLSIHHKKYLPLIKLNLNYPPFIARRQKFKGHSIPVQFFPSPWKPILHVQLYDPSVFVQFAFMSHSLVDFSKHSSISAIADLKLLL